MKRGLAVVLVAVLVFAGFGPGGLDKGNRLYAEGKYAAAVEAYRQARQQGKDSPELEYNLGTALLQLRRYDEAQQAFQSALSAVDPSLRQRTYYNLGSRFLEAGRGSRDPRAAASLLSGAVQAYKQALTLAPGDSAAKWNYELALREQAKKKQQSQQEQRGRQPRQGPSGGAGGGGGGAQGSPSGGQGSRRNGGGGVMTRQEAARLLGAVEQNEREVFQRALRKGHRQPKTLRNW